MMNTQIEYVWKKNHTVYKAQAVSLWDRFNTFPNAEVTRQRSEELACIALKDGEILGVTTVRPTQVKLLNDNYFYEMRLFVSPENNFPLLGVQLTIATKKFFEENTFSDEGHRFAGMIAVIENEKMNQKWRRAVWPVVDFVFAGFTSKGEQLRISYFKNATI